MMTTIDGTIKICDKKIKTMTAFYETFQGLRMIACNKIISQPLKRQEFFSFQNLGYDDIFSRFQEVAKKQVETLIFQFVLSLVHNLYFHLAHYQSEFLLQKFLAQLNNF